MTSEKRHQTKALQDHKMGSSFSEPDVPWPDHGTDPGYVAVVLRSLDKVRLLYAPQSVLNMVESIVV